MLSRVEHRHQRLDVWPVAAGNVGNLLEWYDSVVFAFLAPVIGARFFPSADALSGLIKTTGDLAAPAWYLVAVALVSGCVTFVATRPGARAVTPSTPP
jgi:hypothetical protein